MELILEQLVEELKELVEALEESILNFPRPNIIMSGQHEESAKISFKHREFKNLILLQNSLQEEYEKQLSTSLLKTQLFRELSQLVICIA